MQKHLDAGHALPLVEKGTAEIALSIRINEKNTLITFLAH